VVKKGIKIEVGERRREYLVDLVIDMILLNALLHCTVSSELPRSSRSKL
jgi:hypothetical protein